MAGGGWVAPRGPPGPPQLCPPMPYPLSPQQVPKEDRVPYPHGRRCHPRCHVRCWCPRHRRRADKSFTSRRCRCCPKTRVFQCCCPPWAPAWVNRLIATLNPWAKQETWGAQGQAQGQGKGPQAPSLCTALSTNESQPLSPKTWSCGTTLLSRNDRSNLCPRCGCSLRTRTTIATNGRGCRSFLKGFIKATGTCTIISRCFKGRRRSFQELGVSMSTRSWVQNPVCFARAKFPFMTPGCNHTKWSSRSSTSEYV